MRLPRSAPPVGVVLVVGIALSVGTVLAKTLGSAEDRERPPSGVYETYAWSPDAAALSARLAQRYSPSARTVYVASSSSWTDALAGTPLTSGGALFLVDAEATAADDLDIGDATQVQQVVVLGGEAAVSRAVEASLRRQFPDAVLERIAGEERYATAARLALRAGPADTVLLASGEDYPDALSAGAAATQLGAAVLLTELGRVPAVTVAALRSLAVDDVRVIGGESAVGPAVIAQLEALGITVRRVSGADRYLTAVEVARTFFGGHDTQAFLADGDSFQAAVITSSSAANVGAPLLLKRAACTPVGVSDYLAESGVAWVENAAIDPPGGATVSRLDEPCEAADSR